MLLLHCLGFQAQKKRSAVAVQQGGAELKSLSASIQAPQKGEGENGVAGLHGSSNSHAGLQRGPSTAEQLLRSTGQPLLVCALASSRRTAALQLLPSSYIDLPTSTPGTHAPSYDGRRRSSIGTQLPQSAAAGKPCLRAYPIWANEAACQAWKLSVLSPASEVLGELLESDTKLKALVSEAAAAAVAQPSQSSLHFSSKTYTYKPSSPEVISRCGTSITISTMLLRDPEDSVLTPALMMELEGIAVEQSYSMTRLSPFRQTNNLAPLLLLTGPLEEMAPTQPSYDPGPRASRASRHGHGHGHGRELQSRKSPAKSDQGMARYRAMLGSVPCLATLMELDLGLEEDNSGSLSELLDAPPRRGHVLVQNRLSRQYWGKLKDSPSDKAPWVMLGKLLPEEDIQDLVVHLRQVVQEVPHSQWLQHAWKKVVRVPPSSHTLADELRHKAQQPPPPPQQQQQHDREWQQQQQQLRGSVGGVEVTEPDKGAEGEEQDRSSGSPMTSEGLHHVQQALSWRLPTRASTGSPGVRALQRVSQEPRSPARVLASVGSDGSKPAPEAGPGPVSAVQPRQPSEQQLMEHQMSLPLMLLGRPPVFPGRIGRPVSRNSKPSGSGALLHGQLVQDEEARIHSFCCGENDDARQQLLATLPPLPSRIAMESRSALDVGSLSVQPSNRVLSLLASMDVAHGRPGSPGTDGEHSNGSFRIRDRTAHPDSQAAQADASAQPHVLCRSTSERTSSRAAAAAAAMAAVTQAADSNALPRIRESGGSARRLSMPAFLLSQPALRERRQIAINQDSPLKPQCSNRSKSPPTSSEQHPQQQPPLSELTPLLVTAHSVSAYAHSVSELESEVGGVQPSAAAVLKAEASHASHAQEEEAPIDSAAEELELWHEVQVLLVHDPVTSSEAVMLLQTDITARAMVERRMAALTETQLSMLENMFPRHVLEFMCSSASHSDVGSLACKHDQVSILFLDIVGFTNMCKGVAPDIVMEYINRLFGRFDELCTHYSSYKLDTAGDAYIACGALMTVDAEGFFTLDLDSDPSQGARNLVEYAQAMLRHARLVPMPDGLPTSVRIGIHTGSVVSGVTGTKLLKFSLYGDTMNTSSRMESTSKPGCIQISDVTHALLSPEQQAMFRPLPGGVEVKGKGLMSTFLYTPAAAELELRPEDLHIIHEEDEEQELELMTGLSHSNPRSDAVHARRSSWMGLGAAPLDVVLLGQGNNNSSSISTLLSAPHGVQPLESSGRDTREGLALLTQPGTGSVPDNAHTRSPPAAAAAPAMQRPGNAIHRSATTAMEWGQAVNSLGGGSFTSGSYAQRGAGKAQPSAGAGAIVSTSQVQQPAVLRTHGSYVPVGAVSQERWNRFSLLTASASSTPVRRHGPLGSPPQVGLNGVLGSPPYLPSAGSIPSPKSSWSALGSPTPGAESSPPCSGRDISFKEMAAGTSLAANCSPAAHAIASPSRLELYSGALPHRMDSANGAAASTSSAFARITHHSSGSTVRSSTAKTSGQSARRPDLTRNSMVLMQQLMHLMGTVQDESTSLNTSPRS